MQDARNGQPAGGQGTQAVPVEAVALAALPQLSGPQADQPFPKGPQAVQVARYRVIVEAGSADRWFWSR